ncbi:hypothetical protein [Argonema antarcticum]|uniref:hypothetical protein n=1 Tax=Argonema antarcticum TaxID=2942763 RepID=UPI0020124AE6|nr:hypothetical protein [Argonema antarcticum]MCL1469715.1 hypothetical protein [Argonema antarcticum A004/B2]
MILTEQKHSNSERAEGRRASLLFDEEFYLRKNQDVAVPVASGIFQQDEIYGMKSAELKVLSAELKDRPLAMRGINLLLMIRFRPLAMRGIYRVRKC